MLNILEEDKSMQMLTLVHIFQKSNQDSFFVFAVIDDVIQQLKQAMPQLKSVKFTQGNDGCYHSGITILGVRELGIKHNVDIRMDFSDPQVGKGSCDHKAANSEESLAILPQLWQWYIKCSSDENRDRISRWRP
jgi:hypothetical protein